jgi:surfactin synthase thioesterase subunit
MNTVNLFCLPFAGGNKYSYRAYEKNAPPFLKLIPVEYSGRGTRSTEPLVRSIDVLVNDVYSKIKSRLSEKPYAIYGHSMGGLAAWLLAVKIIENGDAPPVHLFVTGTTGPSALSREEKKTYLLGREEFMKAITDMDGIPDELLAHKELLDYIEPILRADFTATDTFSYRPAPVLQVPITVITGTGENFQEEDIRTWENETTAPIDFLQMPGKHFFIAKYAEEIMKIIANKISSVKTISYERNENVSETQRSI